MPSRRSIPLLFLAGALLAGFGGCGSGGDSTSLSAGEPELVSPSQLSEFAGEANTPVYWLGERVGAKYELTETDAGRIYVRYLRGNAEADDPRSSFVTVGTYPSEDGIAKLRQAARAQEGAKLGRAADGSTLLGDPSSTSAYLVYPGGDTQVEVYSPVPGQALRLASAGAVREVP
ncbi:MAG TPA: hypothetical protein VH275_05170 [Solirubrobacterales bacterium]|jgi:hypothetical protein|nr:hypothetical protein [Solirubrobacterales bacterium]